MFIKECMHKDVASVAGDTSIFEADRIMRDKDLPYLLVVDDGRAVGVVTRDAMEDNVMRSYEPMSISQFVAALFARKVRDTMHNVITVEPDTPIEYAMIIGEENGVSVFPVLQDKELIGVATATDFLKRASEVYGYDESSKQFHLLISCKTSSLSSTSGLRMWNR
jgi:CBS domain-containing protein